MIQSIVIIVILLLCAGAAIVLWVSLARRGDLWEILLLIGEALLPATGGGQSHRKRWLRRLHLKEELRSRVSS